TSPDAASQPSPTTNSSNHLTSSKFTRRTANRKHTDHNNVAEHINLDHQVFEFIKQDGTPEVVVLDGSRLIKRGLEALGDDGVVPHEWWGDVSAEEGIEEGEGVDLEGMRMDFGKRDEEQVFLSESNEENGLGEFEEGKVDIEFLIYQDMVDEVAQEILRAMNSQLANFYILKKIVIPDVRIPFITPRTRPASPAPPAPPVNPSSSPSPNPPTTHRTTTKRTTTPFSNSAFIPADIGMGIPPFSRTTSTESSSSSSSSDAIIDLDRLSSDFLSIISSDRSGSMVSAFDFPHSHPYIDISEPELDVSSHPIKVTKQDLDREGTQGQRRQHQDDRPASEVEIRRFKILVASAESFSLELKDGVPDNGNGKGAAAAAAAQHGKGASDERGGATGSGGEGENTRKGYVLGKAGRISVQVALEVWVDGKFEVEVVASALADGSLIL
ncbi:hypothetical protein HK102_010530, partial [Quaeritorhiza haematococci]